MGFESLDNLKTKCQNLINLIGVDDLGGFSGTQKLSAKIFEIEHDEFNSEIKQELSILFNEYKSNWLENFREYCNLIRLFSVNISDERIKEAQILESESKKILEKIKGVNLQNEIEKKQIILEIKQSTRQFGDVYNKCKIDCIGIKHELEEMAEIFPHE